MSERDDLLASVADTIKTYRKGELPEPTPEHVDRWLRQFTPAQRLPFLREFDHVIKQTYFTRKNVKDFLRALVTNAKLAGADPAAYWSSANFLNIQQNGQSQKDMLKLFSKCLEDECGLDLDDCGETGGDFIYLDDVMFSGNRVGNDLEQWIVNKAPQSASVHVIVAALHSGGSYLVDKRLKSVVEQSGKKIAVKYWRALEIENRKWYTNSSGVLWPTVAPNVAEVQAYMALPSKFPFEPRQPSAAAIQPLSSEAGRQVLESEFFIAGAKIRAMSENPRNVSSRLRQCSLETYVAMATRRSTRAVTKDSAGTISLASAMDVCAVIGGAGFMTTLAGGNLIFGGPLIQRVGCFA